jgi:hypothetical protein
VLQLLRQQDARNAETNEQVIAGQNIGSIRRDQADGVTDTVGVIFASVTVTDFDPDALL